MKLSIKQFAALAGVSVRTLHYYDSIGLLKPDFVDDNNGYRFYGEKALSRMQEILFYRELEFPLKTVKEIITSPNYNKNAALRGQKELLVLKKQRLERIITAIEAAEKGETIMNFDAFDKSDLDEYKAEAKQRWGNTEEYKQSKIKNTPADTMVSGMNAIMEQFAVAKTQGVKANDPRAVELAKQLQDFITRTQYNCTDEILRCLGEMYVGDERFKANIDKHGEGTAEYVHAVINAYITG